MTMWKKENDLFVKEGNAVMNGCNGILIRPVSKRKSLPRDKLSYIVNEDSKSLTLRSLLKVQGDEINQFLDK